MFGSTEKAIHVVGKTVLGLLVLLLCVCVGWNAYQIKQLRDYRLVVIDLSEQVDDARDSNVAEQIEREKFLDRIKADWSPKRRAPALRRQPLRQWVFYPRP